MNLFVFKIGIKLENHPCNRGPVFYLTTFLLGHVYIICLTDTLQINQD